eukprot:GHVP01000010.1.p1 GENE.GHVP01000010.1~~GHVP01000010.1.p1  ORF type:complete len:103 (+),score=15.57 GHVP01000010.1:884-1192(+)
MHIPKKNMLEVYTSLFESGVLIVAKNRFENVHSDLQTPNHQIKPLMRSLKSKGCVTEVFSWQYSYFTITAEGIQYLRRKLFLSDSAFPETSIIGKPSEKEVF